MSFSPRTLHVDGEAAFPGFRITGERVLADGNGNLLWIVNPPQRRSGWARSSTTSVMIFSSGLSSLICCLS